MDALATPSPRTSDAAGWFPQCPTPPTWNVDWSAIDDAYAWIRQLRGCPQDPIHHAEGDVWIHTRMVCAYLAGTTAFRALTPSDRTLLFATAALHDVGKPACTRIDGDGRVTSSGHSRRGAIAARGILWRLGVPFAAREQVAALIRYHQFPFYLIDRPDSRRQAIAISQTARTDLLALLAESDARGRYCSDAERLIENIALFTEYCREQGCAGGPYPFSSDHARVEYFRRPDRDPDYAAYDDSRANVVVMSGLPGAGKDSWIQANLPDWPVISLDAIRTELGVAPTDPSGPVVQVAKERAKGFLRQGKDFVWNATNISRTVRSSVLDLCADYRARVRIVYVEVPEERLFRQNQSRAAKVPDEVILRLLDHWEVPDQTEAHQVTWAVSED